MDADTGKIIGPPLPIGTRVDGNVFDPETGIVASSTGDGAIHIFHEDSSGKLSAVEVVKAEYGAKTMALDPKRITCWWTRRISIHPAAAQRKARPGTFHLLVYGR